MQGAKEALARGANVNCRNPFNSWSPLHFACASANDELAIFLLSAGADPEAQSTLKSTPLQLAEKNGASAIVPLFFTSIQSSAAQSPNRSPGSPGSPGVFEGNAAAARARGDDDDEIRKRSVKAWLEDSSDDDLI